MVGVMQQVKVKAQIQTQTNYCLIIISVSEVVYHINMLFSISVCWLSVKIKCP